MGRSVLSGCGVGLIVAGVVPTTVGMLCLRAGVGLCRAADRDDWELWTAYLTHPSASEWARRVVRGGAR